MFFDERHSPVRRRQAKISQVFGRSRSTGFKPVQPVKPVLYCKGHPLSFTSVCEPVCRVSDEGGFGRAWPIGHAQPVSRVSGKTDRSRGWKETRKTPNTIMNKERIEISTPPVVWRGMWRGQTSGFSSKKVRTFCKRHHQPSPAA